MSLKVGRGSHKYGQWGGGLCQEQRFSAVCIVLYIYFSLDSHSIRVFLSHSNGAAYSKSQKFHLRLVLSRWVTSRVSVNAETDVFTSAKRVKNVQNSTPNRRYQWVYVQNSRLGGENTSSFWTLTETLVTFQS